MPPASPPRTSRWEWAQTTILAANLAWTTLYMGGYRPEAQSVTLLLTTALVVVHAAARIVGRNIGAAHPASGWVLPFVVYAAANVIWVTPARWLGWLDWLNWAQMAAVFWVVLNGIRAPAPRRMIVAMLVGLGVVGVLLSCYQRFVRPDWVIVGERAQQFIGRASGSFTIPNSFAAWLILLLPALGALALRRRASMTARIWWGWVAAVFLFGLVLTLSRGAWLALLLALVAWPLSYGRWTWRRRMTVTVGVALVAVLASFAVYRASPKARERVAVMVRDSGERTRPLMWRGAWALFGESPFVGTGAGSYNAAFEKHRPERFPDTPLWAHNEYLNTLSDYGAIGFILFFGAVAVIGVKCARARHDDRAFRAGWIDSPTMTRGLCVGLLAFALQMAVDFHFKIPALAMAFATVAALVVGNLWPASAMPLSSKPRGAARTVYIVTAATSVIAVAFFFLPLLRSETWRVPARRAIDRLGDEAFALEHYRATLPAVRTALSRAVDVFPGNGQAWADLSYATALMPLLERDKTVALGAEAERYAERALAQAKTHAEYWLRRGIARDLQGKWVEAGEDFVKATSLAPANAVAWYYYAEHLSRVKAAREAADAALAFCLRLDPGNTPGLALRQRLALESSTR